MFLKDGSISLSDFLNDNNKFKNKTKDYGLTDNISDSFLYSKIKIIEVKKAISNILLI